MRLKHQIECTRFGECATLHFLRAITGLKLIFAESTVADRAINERITEVCQVATGFKHLGRSKDGCVNEHNIVSLLNHAAHPGVLDIAQHQRTKRTVVIRRTESAINFGTWIDKTTALAEVDYLL